MILQATWAGDIRTSRYDNRALYVLLWNATLKIISILYFAVYIYIGNLTDIQWLHIKDAHELIINVHVKDTLKSS